MGGPEYISSSSALHCLRKIWPLTFVIAVIAGEAKDPRRTVPRAFRTIIARLLVFFVGGGLCVGVSLLVQMDANKCSQALRCRSSCLPTTQRAYLVPFSGQRVTTNKSLYLQTNQRCQNLRGFISLVRIPPPWAALKLRWCFFPSVISMERLKIPVLPSIVNAALLTSIISAGNAYTFNASRSLHALSLEGQAPKFLRRLNKKYVSSTRLPNTYVWLLTRTTEVFHTWPLLLSCCFRASPIWLWVLAVQKSLAGFSSRHPSEV